MESKLNIQQTLVDGIGLGLKNIVNLLLTALLFMITFWIPYLNVGTTIGFYKVIISLSKGEPIDPTSLFSKDNFKSLGDFFLLVGLETAGVGAAAVFFLFPAMVVSLAWQFAIYFFLDRKTSPLKSLGLSYDATCGEKWRLFFVYMALAICICVVMFLLTLIPKVGVALCFLAMICVLPAVMGVEATLYKYFSAKADEFSK